MTLRPTCDEDIEVFRRLTAADRLEERTCRPVIAGKRVPRDDREQHWTFVLEERHAGWIILSNFNPRNRSAEFGYGVVAPLRGQGVGRRMLACAFDQFFAASDLNKLHCQTASFNIPSVRLLESLGLTRDGVLRAEHEMASCMTISSTVCFGMNGRRAVNEIEPPTFLPLTRRVFST